MWVVLYRLSTSNHNCPLNYYDKVKLCYIVSLHQTTTLCQFNSLYMSCVISSLYIKPQLCIMYEIIGQVVLYRLSTSNHNRWLNSVFAVELCYIVSLHQTTTHPKCSPCDWQLCYIVSLHQTTTDLVGILTQCCCVISSLYIKPQPPHWWVVQRYGCVISSLYIKPQLFRME